MLNPTIRSGLDTQAPISSRLMRTSPHAVCSHHDPISSPSSPYVVTHGRPFRLANVVPFPSSRRPRPPAVAAPTAPSGSARNIASAQAITFCVGGLSAAVTVVSDSAPQEPEPQATIGQIGGHRLGNRAAELFPGHDFGNASLVQPDETTGLIAQPEILVAI